MLVFTRGRTPRRCKDLIHSCTLFLQTATARSAQTGCILLCAQYGHKGFDDECVITRVHGHFNLFLVVFAVLLWLPLFLAAFNALVKIRTSSLWHRRYDTRG